MKRGFDDLIDGLTFGIAAGVAFAAHESIALNSQLFLHGEWRVEGADAAVWTSLVIVGGLLKPIVYGSAIGIAVAAFSGLGEGNDGFTNKYVRGCVEGLGALVAFHVGIYLTGRLEGSLGVILGLVWALIVALYLVLRVRVVLHTALLEGALEAKA